jgi:hypothetical protein
VLDHVRQGLLHDAVGREVESSWEGASRALRGDRDHHSGLANLLDKTGHRVQTGLGFNPWGARVGVTEYGQHAAHLRQRLPSGPLDHPERLGGLGRPGLRQMSPHAGPHGDDAHRMSDHVMQLAGDASPFVGDGALGQLLPRLLQGPGLVLQLLGVRPPGRDDDAECPREREHDGDVADLQQVGVRPPTARRSHEHPDRGDQRNRA